MNARGRPGIMQVRHVPSLWPGPGQSQGMQPTCMIPGMPWAFIICLLWILPSSGHRKHSQASSRWFTNQWKLCQTKQNNKNPSKWTNMGRFGLRIRLFESQSHFLSIGKPPRPSKSNQNTSESTGFRPRKSVTTARRRNWPLCVTIPKLVRSTNTAFAPNPTVELSPELK